MSIRYTLCFSALASSLSTGAVSKDIDPETVQMIYGTAVLLCGDFSATGQATQSSQEIEKSLEDLSNSLTQRGESEKTNLATSTYAGLLQEQLGSEFSDVRSCRLQIWNDLKTSIFDEEKVEIALPDLSARTANYSRNEAQFMVFFGAFKFRAGAEQRSNDMRRIGLLTTIIETNNYPNLSRGYYAVVLPARSRQEANELVKIAKTQVHDAYAKSPW